MRPGRSLDDLFDQAAGAEGKVDLGEGMTVTRSGMTGELTIGDRPLASLTPEAVKAVAEGLQRAAGERYLDPAMNPMIKLPD